MTANHRGTNMIFICGQIVDDVQAVCAVLNIIALIVFAIIEAKRRNEDIRYSKEKDIIERKRLWYEKLVIDKTALEVSEYYRSVSKYADSITDIDVADAIKELKNKLYTCKHAVSPFLSIFSKDLARNTFRTMTKSYDCIVQEIEKDRLKRNSLSIRKTVEADCLCIMKSIYEYDFERKG